MAGLINYELLSGAMRLRRAGRSLREVSPESGVSASTMSRIERGHYFTAENYMLICLWLNREPAAFWLGELKDEHHPKEVDL